MLFVGLNDSTLLQLHASQFKTFALINMTGTTTQGWISYSSAVQGYKGVVLIIYELAVCA